MTLLLWYTVEQRTAQYATVKDSLISHISKRQAESSPHNKASSVSKGKTTSAMNCPDTLRTLSSVWGWPPAVIVPGSQTEEEKRQKATRVWAHAHTTTADKWISCRLLFTSKPRHLPLNPISANRVNPDSLSHKQHAYKTKPPVSRPRLLNYN